MKPLRKKIVASILVVLGLSFSPASFSYGLGYVPASASGGTSSNTNNTASSATNASNNNISNQGVNSSSGSGNLTAGPINSGNAGMTYQGDINSGNTSISNVRGSPAGAQGANVPTLQQSIFGDPGTGAVITGIPLIWYYIDSFGMRSCGDDSDPIVETTKYVSISYEADCGLKTKNSDGNIDKTKPSVKYASDLNPNAYYQPLGELMVQANWDVSDQVSLFTIIKSATNFLAKHIRGYDKVIMVGDILQRNVASQRMIEGNSQGLVISPSISSMMGRDGLAGSMFGYGKTNGESRPANRAGITLLVFAEAAGPWAGRKPNFSQFQYVSNATALPKGIQKNAEQSGVVTKHIQEEAMRRTTVQQSVGR
jgi:hypothetical protein